MPLRATRLLAGLETLFVGSMRDYREPDGVCVLIGAEFGDLVGSQAWRAMRCWQDL